MRIVFMGSSPFAVPFLETLVAHHDVTCVVTAPDRPRGRGKKMLPCPAAEKARALGVTTLCPEDPAEIVADILREPFDFLVTVAYGKKVPSVLLQAPLQESLNVHASLLPSLRGAAPITRAIERGHKETGLSIMRMVARMDAGPVFAQKRVAIAADETKASLTEKLLAVGPGFLLEIMERIVEEGLEPLMQDESAVTWAKKVTREEEEIDFSLPAAELERKIRAFAPTPGLRTTVRGKLLKILAADCVTHGPAAAGTIVKRTNKEAHVACGEDALSLRRVQLSGKKPVDIVAFLNGAGRTLFEEGLVLGEKRRFDSD